MKTLHLQFIPLLFCSYAALSQCGPVAIPAHTYSPNSSSTGTPGIGLQYLCGPNTVLYDTTSSSGTFNVYANSGSTLYLKGTNPITHSVWLKSGSTLNILYPSQGVNIHMESGAIINNPSGISCFTTVCSGIVFPQVNCPTALTNFENELASTHLFPNPAGNSCSVLFSNGRQQPVQIEIYNHLGQLLGRVNSGNMFNNTMVTFDTSYLPDGNYLLKFSHNGLQYHKALFVNR